MTNHEPWAENDPDCPEEILDRDGVMIVTRCKKCGRQYLDLNKPCDKEE